jgi:RNA polymerase sigma factor (TIGR02999 family)
VSIASLAASRYRQVLTLEHPAPDSSLTNWLHRLREDDPQALPRLLPLVYDELRALAHAQLRGERPGHTLGTTALVHEAYMRLARRDKFHPEDRRHFFAIAAQCMRRVLIDYARARKRQKRGAGVEFVPLDDVAPFLSDEAADELVALDDALQRLATANPRAASVVEQRYFAGLTLEETASVLGVSLKTVQRDWIVAQAWLRKEIRLQLAPETATASAIDVLRS